MNSKSIRRIAILVGLWLVSCNESKEIWTQDQKPVITFDAQDHIYRIKVGKTLLLAPDVKYSGDPAYRWLLNGETVGSEATYSFRSDVADSYYMTFEVTDAVATVFEEIRIDVAEMLPPLISLAVPDGGFVIQTGTAKEFKPVLTNGEGASFSWEVNGRKAAQTKDFTFTPEDPGDFELLVCAQNEDGTDELGFTVSVRNPEDMPFLWDWETDVYNMKAGRTIIIAPVSVSNAYGAVYKWQIDGENVREQAVPAYSFTPVAPGEYRLEVTMENEYLAVSRIFTVNVFDNEDAFFRPVTATSEAEFDKVWEFLPAPGQFINQYREYVNGQWVNDIPENMDHACRVARKLMENESHVSLGAFGGYIIVGFDHSVENDGGYNIQITGNSFAGSSEPGIVWVMQDENGDGLPNDTWYELKGSEHRKEGTLYNYTVTYYRPREATGEPVLWVDNHGNEGTIDRNGYHSQGFYPNWAKGSSYTLRGTRLQDKTTYDGSNWHNGTFDWGYADNFGSDRFTDGDNPEAKPNNNHFKISDAVDPNGDDIYLEYIDFVKVQTGVQAKAGALGEVSTEVLGIRDYNMIKNK